MTLDICGDFNTKIKYGRKL